MTHLTVGSAGEIYSQRPSGKSWASIVSLVFAVLCVGMAYVLYRWTSFVTAVDLGDNDFAGLAYILVELVLLSLSACFGGVTTVLGVIGVRHGKRRWVGMIGAGIGILLLLLVCLMVIWFLFLDDDGGRYIQEQQVMRKSHDVGLGEILDNTIMVRFKS